MREKEEKRERARREEEERKFVYENKSFITKREISEFGLGKPARRLILVSFPNFVEEICCSSLRV